MKVKDSIFGGGPERRLFRSLESTWSERIDIYPNLPFASILSFSDARLTDVERQFLFKTSVDYTACEKSGRPLACVEFDGLGHGYNARAGYVEIVPTNRDPG